MRLLSFVSSSIVVVSMALSGCPANPPSSASSASSPSSPAATAVGDHCVHGVKADLCARCTPALKPAFVAKNDWCAEHERPESQCVLCHPDLAQKGVK